MRISRGSLVTFVAVLAVAALSLVNTAEAMTCELTFTPPTTEIGTCIYVYTPGDPMGVGGSFGSLGEGCACPGVPSGWVSFGESGTPVGVKG